MQHFLSKNQISSKIVLFCSLLMATSASFAADASEAKPFLFQQNFSELKGSYLSVNPAKNCEAKVSLDTENLPKGVASAAKVEIINRGDHPARIQFMIYAPFKMKPGETYRVTYKYAVSKPAEIPVEVLCQQKGRFFRPAQDARARLSTAGGVWENAVLEFTVEENIPDKTVIRILNFSLGRLPNGSIFRCADIQVLKVK